MSDITQRDPGSRRLRSRMERCRRLADLLQYDEAGTRLAALAVEIEQQLQRHGELAVIVNQWERDSAEIIAEIDRMVALSRSALLTTKIALRNYRFTPDDLREESRLCREEAVACKQADAQRGFARRALDLAYVAEAISRSG
jgi:hypothetical protein